LNRLLRDFPISLKMCGLIALLETLLIIIVVAYLVISLASCTGVRSPINQDASLISMDCRSNTSYPATGIIQGLMSKPLESTCPTTEIAAHCSCGQPQVKGSTGLGLFTPVIDILG